MIRNSTKIIAILSGVCLVVSVVILIAFSYMVSKQKVLHTTYVREQAEAQLHRESLLALLNTLTETKAERVSLVSRFLKEEDVIDFLALIEKLGGEQGTKLVTNTLNVQPINNTFESLLVQANVSGSLSAVLRTVALLEHLPYQVTISRIQLQSNESTQWKASLDIKLTKFKKHED